MSKEQESKPTPFWSRGDKTIWDFVSLFSLPVILVSVPLIYQYINGKAELSRDQIRHQQELVDGYIKYVQELILDNVYASAKDPKVELVDIEFLLRSKTTTTILALKDNESSQMNRGLLLGFLREKNIGFMPRDTDYRDPLIKKMVARVYCPKDFDYFPPNEKGTKRNTEYLNEELKKLKKKFINNVLLPEVKNQIIEQETDRKKRIENEEKLRHDLDKKLKFRIGFLTILCGLDLSKSTLSENDLALSLLGDADFTEAKLIGTNFTDSRMNGAKFNNADLSKASLQGAELRKALFAGSTLEKTNFSNADLRGAKFSIIKYKDSEGRDQERTNDLSGANLSGANLTGANLTGSNLTGAILSPFVKTDDKGKEKSKKVDFTNANLTKVQGVKEADLKDSILCKTTMFDGKKIENRDCK